MGLGSRRRPFGTPITPGRRGQNAPEGFLSPYRAIMPFQSDPPQSVMDFLSHRKFVTPGNIYLSQAATPPNIRSTLWTGWCAGILR